MKPPSRLPEDIAGTPQTRTEQIIQGVTILHPGPPGNARPCIPAESQPLKAYALMLTNLWVAAIRMTAVMRVIRTRRDCPLLYIPRIIRENWQRRLIRRPHSNKINAILITAIIRPALAVTVLGITALGQVGRTRTITKNLLRHRKDIKAEEATETTIASTKQLAKGLQ